MIPRTALHLAEKVMAFIQAEADSASQELAKVRGNFPTGRNPISSTRLPAMAGRAATPP